METTNTQNENIMVNDTTAFDNFICYATTRKLPEGYDIPPVEEIGMQNIEIVDAATDAIQQPLVNTDSSIAVNFSQMINKPEVEEVKTEVASVPDNGETKVNVVFP